MMTKTLFSALITTSLLAGGCSQFKTQQTSDSIIEERVPIMVAARMRDNQPPLPPEEQERAFARAVERIPANLPRPKIRKAPEQTIEFAQSEPKPEKTIVAYDVELFKVDNEVLAAVEARPDLEVELFANIRTSSRPAPIDVRETGFVRLNGESRTEDWKVCEGQRGFLLAIENELHIDPAFEVCMRNKGYVMAHEVDGIDGIVLTAETIANPDIFANPFQTASLSLMQSLP